MTHHRDRRVRTIIGASLAATLSAFALEARAADKDACALLTLDEVQSAFPDAATPRPETSLKEYGIFACDWLDAGGARTLQVRVSTGTTAEDELGMFAMGMSDPLSPKKVKTEPVEGLPGKAGAIILGRGESDVTSATAILVVQHGADVIGLATTALADRSKDDTKAVLIPLIKAAYDKY